MSGQQSAARVSCAALARELPVIHHRFDEIDRRLASKGADHLPYEVARELEEQNFRRLHAIEDAIIALSPRDLADAAAFLMIAADVIDRFADRQYFEQYADELRRGILAVAILCAKASAVEPSEVAFVNYARGIDFKGFSNVNA